MDSNEKAVIKKYLDEQISRTESEANEYLKMIGDQIKHEIKHPGEGGVKAYMGIYEDKTTHLNNLKAMEFQLSWHKT